jgi:signal transduction histidine kinase
MHLRCVMCVPLADGEEKLGAIYVDSLTASEQELSAAARFLRGLAGFAAVAVTNASRLQDAARRMERARDLAHDLSKPIAAMIGLARELSTHAGIDPEARAALEEVVAHGEHASALVRSLILRRQRSHEVLDLCALVRREADAHRRAGRRVEVGIHVHAPGRALVRGDGDELRRAIGNLVDNALRHTAHGSTVEVRVWSSEAEILCSIRDHGPGLSPSALPTLFDRGGEEGEGLGLAIARRVIVQDHQGRLWAENHPEGGAVFTVGLARVE